MQQIMKDLATDAAMQHMSAQHIADRTGLDRKTVSAILTGETDSPKLQTLQTIAECLGGSVAYVTKDSFAAVKSGDISYYRTMIAGLHYEAARKDRWLKVLFITCLGLIVLDAITTMLAFVLAS